jgi:hypothetical protein
MPGAPGVIRGDLLVCFYFSHARLRAHWTPGIPCALVFDEGRFSNEACAISWREIGDLCPQIMPSEIFNIQPSSLRTQGPITTNVNCKESRPPMCNKA